MAQLTTSAATGSMLSHLEGSLSGRRYSSSELRTTDPVDGRPLLARYDLERVGSTLARALQQPRSRGLWRWLTILAR